MNHFLRSKAFTATALPSRAFLGLNTVRAMPQAVNIISAARSYSGDLEPGEKKDFDAYVSKWLKHFKKVEDNFELERGLNHIFAADWVPSVEVVSEALRAARRVNSFATAVRIVEALEQKVDKSSQYQEYIKALGPLLNELGVPEKKDLGTFDFVMEKRWKNM